MTRIARALVLLTLLLVPVRAATGDEQNLHLELLKDGEPDTDQCGMCHNDDLTLARSKEETCTLCHTVAEHGGALAHVQAKPGAVTLIVPTPKPGEVNFPLTDDGGMYCGTCHLFHDPQGVISGEKWLPDGCAPSTSSFAIGVAASVDEYRNSIAGAQAAHFVKVGTRALRLPVCDGSLCLHCHGDKR